MTAALAFDLVLLGLCVIFALCILVGVFYEALTHIRTLRRLNAGNRRQK